MSLSQNIKKYRLRKGLTQEGLASILGLSAQAVSKWETSETYPDGAMLVPLANVLEVSLDALFDNETASMKEISGEIARLIKSAPHEDGFKLTRELCWQIEKALFNYGFSENMSYVPDEIEHLELSSHILNDYGFTVVSNGRAPFFSVFPQFDENYSDVIGDGEEMRKIFDALSSPETMRAVLFIHRHEKNYVFEKEYLGDVCDIPEEKLDGVIDDLAALHLLYPEPIDMNGEQRTLFFTEPSHVIIALFLFAHEIDYRGGYCCQAGERTKPYLK